MSDTSSMINVDISDSKSPTDLNQRYNERNNYYKDDSFHDPNCEYRKLYLDKKNRPNSTQAKPVHYQPTYESQYKSTRSPRETYKTTNLDLASKAVTKRSCASLINDLSYIRKLDDHSDCKPNVIFRFADTDDNEHKDKIAIHSFILLARSTFFRRSWRNFKSEQNTNSGYNFDKNFDRLLTKVNIKLELISRNQQTVNSEFRYKISMSKGPSSIDVLVNSFRELKRFLYSGECEVNEENANYLIALSHAFEIESLQQYVVDYFIPRLRTDTFDDLFDRLEMAHVYKLAKLKEECIKVINSNPRQVINSVPWKERISEKYPDLVLEIFYQNEKPKPK